MREILRKEEGQALVEFALVLPLLLLIVCGIIDFGWLFYNQLTLENACRVGARYACVHSEDTTIEDDVFEKVKENLPKNLQESAADLKVDTDFDAEEVTVEVTAKMQFLTPIFDMFRYREDSRLMEANFTMKIES